MTELKDWLSLISLAIAVGGAFYAWLTAGSKTNAAALAAMIEKVDDRFKEVERDVQLLGDSTAERIKDQDRIMAQLQEAMKHFPDREQSHRLEVAIEKLAGRMETLDQRMTGRIETLDERLKPVAAASARIQNYLMERPGAEK